jgi:hypothetical protein
MPVEQAFGRARLGLLVLQFDVDTLDSIAANEQIGFELIHGISPAWRSGGRR